MFIYGYAYIQSGGVSLRATILSEYLQQKKSWNNMIKDVAGLLSIPLNTDSEESHPYPLYSEVLSHKHQQFGQNFPLVRANPDLWDLWTQRLTLCKGKV